MKSSTNMVDEQSIPLHPIRFHKITIISLLNTTICWSLVFELIHTSSERWSFLPAMDSLHSIQHHTLSLLSHSIPWVHHETPLNQHLFHLISPFTSYHLFFQSFSSKIRRNFLIFGAPFWGTTTPPQVVLRLRASACVTCTAALELLRTAAQSSMRSCRGEPWNAAGRGKDGKKYRERHGFKIMEGFSMIFWFTYNKVFDLKRDSLGFMVT